jgi:hypothetical protein
VRFLFTYHTAVGTYPLLFFELDYSGRYGPVMAELMPGRVASVAEDYLVGIGRVAPATINADCCFAGFSALLGFLGCYCVLGVLGVLSGFSAGGG